MELLRRGALVALLSAVFLPVVRLEGAVVRPRNGDRALTNPGMGWVYYHFSNRLWAYGGLTEPGDALDWFPGVSTIYLRVPWVALEPREGEFRWDILDSPAQPFVCRFGNDDALPQLNDPVLNKTREHGIWDPGLRVPTIRPGKYDLCVSVGAADATPRLELPLGRELHLRYNLGKITVKRSVLPEKGEK